MWEIISRYYEYLRSTYNVEDPRAFVFSETGNALITAQNAERKMEPSGMVVPPDGAYCGTSHWKRYVLTDGFNVLLSFWLVPLPGCCAVCVVTYPDGPANDERADQFRQEIARHYKYSALLCSDRVEDKGTIDKSDGWSQVFTFGNDRYHKIPTPLYVAMRDLRQTALPNQQ